jgi:hypothetical protein
LPIEVAQGRRRKLQNETLYTASQQLRLSLTPEGFDQQHHLLAATLSRLYGQATTLQLQSGSVIVNVIAEVGDSLGLNAFRDRASTLTDNVLSNVLQVETIRVSAISVTARTVEVPIDVVCSPGFYCSAAASYACPLGSWNNLTGQADSSKCLACPTPERTTTLGEGSSSIDDCVCRVSYYRAPDGDCLTCPVGSDCSDAGVTLSTLPVVVGYFRASNASIDVRRCPDAGENCGGRDDCPQSSSGCRGSSSKPCEPTLHGIFCQLCREDNHHYVSASGAERAHCRECGETLGASAGIFLGSVAGALLLTSTMRRGYRRLSPDTRDALRGAHRKLRLDVKLKIVIGFYMIATQVGSVYEVRLPEDVQRLLVRMATVVTLGIEVVLRTTPLSCVGLPGYVPQLLFWMLTPMLLGLLILLATLLWLAVQPQKVTRWRQAVLLKAAPLVLRLLFFMYPIVTQEAFKAFPCYTFDAGKPTESSWLRADVSIECDTDDHTSAKALALLAIALYPIGLLLLFARLLFLARGAITSGRPTPLSTALGFLHREFEPRFYWWGAHSGRDSNLLTSCVLAGSTQLNVPPMSHM